MPRGLGSTHPEDLPWLEVPHSLSPAEEEPGGGVCLVPKICGALDLLPSIENIDCFSK